MTDTGVQRAPTSCVRESVFIPATAGKLQSIPSDEPGMLTLSTRQPLV